MAEELEKGQFVFEQARCNIRTTITAIEALDKKVFALTAICIPILNGLLGLVVWPTLALPPQVWWASLVYAALVSYCLGILAGVLSPVDLQDEGNEPDNLTEEKYFGQPFEKMVRGEAMTYQSRIDNNLKEAAMKAEALHRSLVVLAFGPFVAILLGLVASYV